MRLFTARAVGIICVVVFLFSFLPPFLFVSADDPTQGWIQDSQVTEIGKAAVRAKQFLDWTLATDNANWVFLSSDVNGLDKLSAFWVQIRNIAYFLVVIVVLFSAFLLIITRGKSINIRKQLLIIGGILLLITFSFTFIDNLYRLIDTLQNFFLKQPHGGTASINSNDLLSVGFPYTDFVGYRKADPSYNEAANASILLVKATSITYYVMAGILLLRKIILWFFIILSPLWVLLLPFPFIRNTAKIWMGEFFRWLFYGPLFAVLLAGLVTMWQLGIPVKTNAIPPPPAIGDYGSGAAISILLGGPGVPVSLTNSVNNLNTYALYVFALLMLWAVVVLPFILLNIFRDVMAGIFKGDNTLFQRAFGALYPFLGRVSPFPFPPPSSPQPSTPPPRPPGAGEGLAQELLLHKPTGLAREIRIRSEVTNIESLPQAKTTDIVRYAGLSIPKLADVAKMEMQRANLSQNQSLLKNIATPTTISNAYERSRFSSIQQELLNRSRRGDVAASTILAAAESARSGGIPVPIRMGTSVSVSSKDRSAQTTQIEKERTGGGTPIVVGTGGRVNTRQNAPITAAKPAIIPTINRIQTVGIDDYEEVKKMWEENYRNGDIPISDKVKSREEWIKHDVTKMESVIELVSSIDEEKKKKGLEELAIILPFLLLGGFSDQETVVYLKAKLEGAKKVLNELEQKTKEEDKVLIENKKEAEGEKEKSMEATVEIDEEASPKPEKPLAQNKESQKNPTSPLKEKIEGGKS